MAKYRINIALWQVPTMVVNSGNVAKDGHQRALLNTMASQSLDERMALLRKRLGKADAFFRSTPVPAKHSSVTVFAAPEYLFARNAAEHFISQKDKDQLFDELLTLSADFPHVVLFPGTIAWKKAAVGPDDPLYPLLSARGQKARLQRETGGSSIYSDKDIKAFEQAQDRNELYYLARNTCYVMHNGEAVLKYHKRDNGGETNRATDGEDVFFVHGARDGVFQAAGLSFGLKICAEVRTALTRLVDVQVVISASSPVTPGDMQLRPGGYCCHADAIRPPTVWHKTKGSWRKSGVIEEVTADVLRRGGGPMSRHRAAQRITHALSFQANPSLDPSSDTYAEKITEMRGRTRYYRLDYEK